MLVHTEVTDNGSTIRIVPPGRFDFSCHREFRDAFGGCNPALNFEVDLRATDYLDSAALGLLLLLRKHAGDTNRVKLLNPKPEVRNILDIVNFGSLFIID